MRKTGVYWSCGVNSFCEHKTKFMAWVHIIAAGIAAGAK